MVRWVGYSTISMWTDEVDIVDKELVRKKLATRDQSGVSHKKAGRKVSGVGGGGGGKSGGKQLSRESSVGERSTSAPASRKQRGASAVVTSAPSPLTPRAGDWLRSSSRVGAGGRGGGGETVSQGDLNLEMRSQSRTGKSYQAVLPSTRWVRTVPPRELRCLCGAAPVAALGRWWCASRFRFCTIVAQGGALPKGGEGGSVRGGGGGGGVANNAADGVSADGVSADGVAADGVSADGVPADGNSADTNPTDGVSLAGCGFEFAYPPSPSPLTPLCKCKQLATFSRARWWCATASCEFEKTFVEPFPQPEPVAHKSLENAAATSTASHLTVAAYGPLSPWTFVAPAGGALGLFARDALKPRQLIALCRGPRLPREALRARAAASELGRGVLLIPGTDLFIDGCYVYNAWKSQGELRAHSAWEAPSAAFPYSCAAAMASHSSKPNARLVSVRGGGEEGAAGGAFETAESLWLVATDAIEVGAEITISRAHVIKLIESSQGGVLFPPPPTRGAAPRSAPRRSPRPAARAPSTSHPSPARRTAAAAR